jgi:hypothetical protein
MTGAYLILTDIFFKLVAIPSITSSVASTEPTPTCVHDHTITTILLHPECEIYMIRKLKHKLQPLEVPRARRYLTH